MEKRNWHDRNYKKLLLIPAALLIFSIVYLIMFNAQTGDFIRKDVSLTGGTAVTIFDQISMDDAEIALSDKLADLDLREISEITTGEQKGIEIKTTEDLHKTKQVLEEYLGYELVNGDNADIVTSGSSFSEGFYKQLLVAILIAFICMAVVVFIIFRSTVPSLAVIISAFADIVMTLVLFNLVGMKMSTASIVAFIMLIGYSVDTDIMLTTRILKRKNEGSLNKRIWDATKTGLTMTLTSFFSLFVALLVVKSFSATLAQIFTVLVIGLGFDILNTWITNVSILKWYAEAKEWKN